MRRSGWESANYFDPDMPGEQHGNAKGSFRRPMYQEIHGSSLIITDVCAGLLALERVFSGL